MLAGTSSQIRELHACVTKLIAATDHVGRYMNGKVVSTRPLVYLYLLQRLHFNLLGVHFQLPNWEQFPGLKMPISLAYRAVLTDGITGLYLATFDQHDDSFLAEVQLLDQKYLGFVEAMAEHASFQRGRLGLTNDPEGELKENLSTIFQNAAHLLDKAGERKKKPVEVRAASNPNLYLANNFKDQLTEEKMYEQIKAHPNLVHLSDIHLVQRFFAQSHHFSVSGRTILENLSEFEFSQWVTATLLTYQVAFMLAKLASVPDEELTLFREGNDALMRLIASAGGPAYS